MPHDPSGPVGAPTPRFALGEIERAAAATPDRSELWQAAIVALQRGRVDDDDVGAAATLGSARPLAVAVVTPYCNEDVAELRRCHESVLAQTYPCRHVMVADGNPRREIDGWDVDHVRLDTNHADFGDTPRARGGERAVALGLDAVAYLDADNSFRTHHVESLVHRHMATGMPVVFSGRTMHFPDGRLVPVVDPEDGRTHIDTSCLLLAKAALPMVSAWLAYPRPYAVIDDRMFVRMLKGRGLGFACTGAVTLRYTVHFAALYAARNLPVPPDARPPLDLAPLARFHAALSPDDRRRLDLAVGFPVGELLGALLAAHDHEAR